MWADSLLKIVVLHCCYSCCWNFRDALGDHTRYTGSTGWIHRPVLLKRESMLGDDPHTLWSCLTLLLAPKNEGTKEKGQVVAGGDEIGMCKIVKVKRQRHWSFSTTEAHNWVGVVRCRLRSYWFWRWIIYLTRLWQLLFDLVLRDRTKKVSKLKLIIWNLSTFPRSSHN
jgi:hypothetical protein